MSVYADGRITGFPPEFTIIVNRIPPLLRGAEGNREMSDNAKTQDPAGADTFDVAELTAELIVDEGERLTAYTDTVGLVTIGIGRELSRKGISKEECMYLFRNDVQACAETMDRDIPWWRHLAPNEQRVMINLCFMGWGSFSQFHRFQAAMEAVANVRSGKAAGDVSALLNTAVTELQNSRWWQQVKSRGPRVVSRLLGTAATSDLVA